MAPGSPCRKYPIAGSVSVWIGPTAPPFSDDVGDERGERRNGKAGREQTWLAVGWREEDARDSRHETDDHGRTYRVSVGVHSVSECNPGRARSNWPPERDRHQAGEPGVG